MRQRKVLVPGSSPKTEITRARLALASLSAEQVDLAAAAIAELANGGRFYDPQFYTEQQRAFWRRVALAALNAAIGAPPDSSPPEKSPNPAGSAG
ncbi:hypothetical protein [Bradyrhizobium quebecense]|uniref:Uncharacterized protein n=2 Tax=Bradyrhizobium quebecense TaxID=2748629 RepID=A0ABS3M8V4_9BRAD|nr:hypothetical protein [Bradyrhizobium quebecense]UGY03260.1 hypothetical protein J4P68_0000310 [Bradyrhizobium quebecense]